MAFRYFVPFIQKWFPVSTMQMPNAEDKQRCKRLLDPIDGVEVGLLQSLLRVMLLILGDGSAQRSHLVIPWFPHNLLRHIFFDIDLSLIGIFSNCIAS